jgi:lysine decarboxylase
VFAGLRPVWLQSSIDPSTGLPLGVSAAAVESAFASHPDVRAVFVSDPSYVGTFSDLSAVARAAHARDAALIVDAAWAPHFGFHPQFPRHALAAGADAMVISAHKALPAYSQAALVLARGERIDPVRLDQAFEATHTTSPAGSILASIDLARALLERDGTRLLGRLCTIVREARDRLKETHGVAVLDGPGVDPSKLVVLLAGTGADGNAVERDLIRVGMPVEMADRDTIVAIVTIADDEQSGRAITQGIQSAVERHRGDPRPVRRSFAWTIEPETVMTPRDAFFAEQMRVRLEEAVGRVSAELLALYPPGIPVLAPGERLTQRVLDAVLEARAEGNRIAYASDASLGTLRVVA